MSVINKLLLFNYYIVKIFEWLSNSYIVKIPRISCKNIISIKSKILEWVKLTQDSLFLVSKYLRFVSV